MERGKSEMNNLNKNFLDSIDGKNLNFLIGAGASSSSLKPISHNDENEKGEKNTPSIEDLFNKYDNDQIATALLKFIFFSMSVKNGLITTHTKRDKGATETLKNYKILIENIITLLNNTGFERPKRANVFTTNYDTFFELAFDQIAHMHPLAYFNDGSRGFFTREVSYENYFFNISHSGSMDIYRRDIPSINLYKMHGSLSWNKKAINKNGFFINSNTNSESESQNETNDKDDSNTSSNANTESKSQNETNDKDDSNTSSNANTESKSQNETNDKDEIIISSNKNPVLDYLTKAKDKDDESFYDKVYKEIKNFYTSLKNPESINTSEGTIKKVTEKDLLINFQCIIKNIKTEPNIKEKINKIIETNDSPEEKINSLMKKEELRKLLSDFEIQFNKLLIVKPSKEKFGETVLEEQYYQLFRAFEEELQKPNSVLIVFGFSFKDKHINDILKRCLTNPTLQVFVVPYSQKDELNVKEIFTGYGNVSFLKEESESKDKDLANENIEYKNGDFDVLNDFLSGKSDINEHN